MEIYRCVAFVEVVLSCACKTGKDLLILILLIQFYNHNIQIIISNYQRKKPHRCNF